MNARTITISSFLFAVVAVAVVAGQYVAALISTIS